MTGQTISHYRVLEKLGAGGMGIVYKAEDSTLGRAVALKFLHPDTTGDPEIHKRFLYEARSAAALNHPNICTVYEIDEASGFLAIEFIEGETIEAKRNRRPLPIDEVLDIAIQTCEGLQAAHEKGIVHRDIKSANLMVTSRGQVKIMDFGLARLSNRTRITRIGASPGTPSYMAPELFDANEADQRSDIWSLGVLIYEMIAGRLPFEAETEATLFFAILNKEPEPLTALRSGVPLELERVVTKALAKNPDARYQHVEDLAVDLKALRRTATPALEIAARGKPKSGKRIAFVTASVVVISAASFWMWRERESNSHQKAMHQVESLADAGAMIEAYRLAQVLDQRNARDPAMTRVWDTIGPSSTIITDPPGADIYIRDYLKPDSQWLRLGQSPMQSGRVPDLFISLRIAKQGYVDVEWSLRPFVVPPVKLMPVDSSPAGMVYIIGTGRNGQAAPLDDFWLDRYETTNADYKKFVDAGGYRDQKFWTQPFVEAGRAIPWEQAMTKFVDATGRPGPANWDLGSFPEGAANLPVTGVSWYEAAAFAEFAGKALPTVHHWRQAAIYQPISSEIIQLSNFEGKGLAPQGKFKGAGFFGNYDMAGNAKEWCWNATGDKRYILGGAWSEPSYLFIDNDARSPFERAETFGFRCARYLRPIPDNLKAPSNVKLRDYAIEKPASDEQFKFFQSLYAYDRTPLDQKVESVNETDHNWRLETITFNAAYEHERVTAYLFVPPKAKPPFQTVVHFPGGYALFVDKVDSTAVHPIRHFVQSGRAVLFPIYKGTFDRKSKSQTSTPLAWRDRLVQMCKDLSRSIDYLETRKDIDPAKIGYHGISLGSVAALPCLANEPRIKTAILQGGGLLPGSAPPEIDPLNFVTRIRFPVVMISGKDDFQFPVEQAQRPLFRLLGSAAAHKRHYLVEGGHVVPRNLVVKESLDWLDKYLGPVSNKP